MKELCATERRDVNVYNAFFFELVTFRQDNMLLNRDLKEMWGATKLSKNECVSMLSFGTLDIES